MDLLGLRIISIIEVVNRLFPILFFLCAMLWAKPSVFIPVVQLEGVHQDYADKVVSLTKGFI